MTEIDPEQLTTGEIRTILQRYEVLVEAMTASNNTLITKLAALPGITNEHIRVLNDWSAFTNGLQHAHHLEVEKAASILN